MERDSLHPLGAQAGRHALGLRAAAAIDDAAGATMARQHVEQLLRLAVLGLGGEHEVRAMEAGEERRRIVPCPARAGCRRACADRRSPSVRCAARRENAEADRRARDIRGGTHGPIATRNAPRRWRTARAAAATAGPACRCPTAVPARHIAGRDCPRSGRGRRCAPRPDRVRNAAHRRRCRAGAARPPDRPSARSAAKRPRLCQDGTAREADSRCSYRRRSASAPARRRQPSHARRRGAVGRENRGSRRSGAAPPRAARSPCPVSPERERPEAA